MLSAVTLIIRVTAHLRSYANDIIQACIKTAKEVTAKNNGSHSHSPGWKDYVTPAREASLFWHNLWNDCGRPRSGVVADCMRRTRLAYHYAIRHVRKQEANMVKEQFAKSIIENRTRDFWSEISRIKNSKAGVCDIVDGVGNSSDIANLFADKYEELYSSV